MTPSRKMSAVAELLIKAENAPPKILTDNGIHIKHTHQNTKVHALEFYFGNKSAWNIRETKKQDPFHFVYAPLQKQSAEFELLLVVYPFGRKRFYFFIKSIPGIEFQEVGFHANYYAYPNNKSKSYCGYLLKIASESSLWALICGIKKYRSPEAEGSKRLLQCDFPINKEHQRLVTDFFKNHKENVPDQYGYPPVCITQTGNKNFSSASDHSNQNIPLSDFKTRPEESSGQDIFHSINEISEQEKVEEYTEGENRLIWSQKYERNKQARNIALQNAGYRCQLCCRSMSEIYGETFCGKETKVLLHAHHIVPVSTWEEVHAINPKTDLIAVCPSCHAVLHINGYKDTIPKEQFISLRETIVSNLQNPDNINKLTQYFEEIARKDD